MSVLIRNGYVVTMNPGREVFEGGFVSVGDDGRIRQVGAAQETPDGHHDEVIDATGMIVLPGLVNAHFHHWQALAKGIGQRWPGSELDLLARLEACTRPEALRLAAFLSAIDLLATGTTCCLNHADVALPADGISGAVDAMAQMGIRHVFSLEIRHGAGPHMDQGAMGEFGRVAEACAERHGDKVGFMLGVRTAPQWFADGTTSERLVGAVYRAAVDRGMRISTHASGGPGHRRFFEASAIAGRTEIMHLMELGVLDERWVLANPTFVSDTDIGLMTEAGCHAVCTPVSDAIRGVGPGRWRRLREAGVNCALGTDGALYDGSVDLVEQMKACVMIQNSSNLDATAVSTETSLEMATINGARALGLEKEIGSLETGKRADIALFDLRAPQIQVLHKPISNFVCAGRGSDARKTLVNGKVVFDNGRFPAGRLPESFGRDLTAAGRELVNALLGRVRSGSSETA